MGTPNTLQDTVVLEDLAPCFGNSHVYRARLKILPLVLSTLPQIRTSQKKKSQTAQALGLRDFGCRVCVVGFFLRFGVMFQLFRVGMNFLPNFN